MAGLCIDHVAVNEQSEAPTAVANHLDNSTPEEETSNNTGSELLPPDVLSSRCLIEPIAEAPSLLIDSVIPATCTSESHKATFEEILPLPKRERPSGKKSRKKPPSYELTGMATMEFVSDRVQKSTKTESKRKKIQKQQMKTNVKARSAAGTGKKTTGTKKKQQINTNAKAKSAAGRWKKTSGKGTSGSHSGLDVCGACGGAYGDMSVAHSNDDWLACKGCSLWFHESCAEENGLVDVDEFICGKCFL